MEDMKETFYENGAINTRTYYLYGAPHNDNAPAIVNWDPDGNVLVEMWYRDGIRHREGDKPAITYYAKDGNITCQEYWVQGQKHRVIGYPSVLQYQNDGLGRRWLGRAFYHVRGNLHREDGPTVARYDEKGIGYPEQFHLQGKNLTFWGLYENTTKVGRLTLLRDWLPLLEQS